MSHIARKLCKDIVEPVVDTIPTNSLKELSRVSQSGFRIIEYCDGKPPSKILTIEKEKASNKSLRDRNSNKSSIIRNLGPRDTTSPKTVIDVAANTVMSGPLKCDNGCVTTLRRREKCNCKIGLKKLTNIKTIARQMQTVVDNKKKYLSKNKACEPCIETATCSTQFSQKIYNTCSQASHSHQKPIVCNNTKLSNSTVTLKNKFYKKGSDMITAINDRYKNWSFFDSQTAWTVKPDVCSESSFKMNKIPLETAYKPSSLRFINEKRWAVSQYPTRGPDF